MTRFAENVQRSSNAMVRKRHFSELIFCIVVIGGIVILDQAVKFWARSVLKHAPDGTMQFMPGFVMLQYAENTGAAFSMWPGQTWLLGVLSAALSVFILWLLYRYRDVPSLLFRLSLCFIAGGALGNVIDRLTIGYVVDMLEFEFVRFAVFNVADSFVCVGAVMFCIYIIFFSNISGREEKEQSDARRDNH